MLEFLRSFFVSIGEFFSNIWSFLVFLWEEITQFFRILTPALIFFQNLISTIHPVFLSFGLAILVVLILYVIIGRNAGGD